MNYFARPNVDDGKKRHGQAKTYVTGYLLSSIFTFIAYYLVVNRWQTGSVLLATILSLAVLQTTVQIVFFLHLGRGPKPLYNLFFFGSTVTIILVVVVGSLFIMSHLHYSMSPSEVTKNLAQKERISQLGGNKTGACAQSLVNHKVAISNNAPSPASIRANLCDSLTFISGDGNLHEITFGAHPSHDSYSGEDKLVLRSNRNKTITLNQTGSFLFHDHLNPAISGTFSVTE